MKTKSKPLNAKEIPVEKDGLAAKDNGALLKKIKKKPINLMIRFPVFKQKKLNLMEPNWFGLNRNSVQFEPEFGSIQFEFSKI
jgi:hypothetical protein